MAPVVLNVTGKKSSAVTMVENQKLSIEKNKKEKIQIIKSLDRSRALNNYEYNFLKLDEFINRRGKQEVELFNNGWLKTMSVGTKVVVCYPLNGSLNQLTRDFVELKHSIRQFNEEIVYMIESLRGLDIKYQPDETIIYNNAVYSEFYFDNPKEIILSSKSGLPVVIKAEENIYVTTLNIVNYGNFVKEVFEREEKTSVPDWIVQYEYFDDLEKKEQMETQNKIIEDANKIIEESIEKIKLNNKYKSILYTQGDKLVSVVLEILGEIFDYNFSNFIDVKKEDFYIKLENKEYIGEIKGVTGSVKNSHISQLVNHYDTYLENNNLTEDDINLKKILIINPNRDTPLEKREKIHSNQIEKAKRDQVLIITTEVLLKIYSDLKMNRITPRKIMELFETEIGVLKY